MKIIYCIILVCFPLHVLGQEINRIYYRGDSIYIYPDSSTNVDIKLIENLPDGNYCGFLRGDTSLLTLRISYKNNKIDGMVILYSYDPSMINSMTNYKNGQKHGHWIKFSADTILHEGDYENGKRMGFQYSYAGPKGNKTEYNKSFYSNDSLKYNIWFKYDSTYYVGDTGYVYESNYTKKLLGYGKTLKGNKYGLWKEFHENGELKSLGNYELFKKINENLSSRKNGKWTDYHENGKIAREYYYTNNQFFERITTIYSQYDSLGTLLDSNNFINGIGLYREFYPNGGLKTEEYYSNSDLYDYLKQFYANGQLRMYNRFKKNKIRIYNHYFENGKTESKERYKYTFTPNDVFAIDCFYHGKQEYYNEDGTLDRIEKYKNGKRIK